MKVLLLLLAIFAIYLGATGKAREFFGALLGVTWSGGGQNFNGAGGGGSSGFQ